MKMKFPLLTLLAISTLAFADVAAVSKSVSPDGKIHAVMDLDRDPKISPKWKGDNVPQIEITEKDTGRVLASISYFGAECDDARTLREHVRVAWRSDSKAFAITIDDRSYSSSKVFALTEGSKFVEVAFPSYEKMTGFPAPASAQLRSRGRSSVEGWDSEGRLIYSIFMSPLPSYSGDDSLEHTVLLEVTSEMMTAAKKTKAEQAACEQPATHSNVLAVKQFTGIYPASASLQIPFHGCVTLDRPLPEYDGEYWVSADHLITDIDYVNLQILVNFKGTILGARAVFKGSNEEWVGARGLASRNRVLRVFWAEVDEVPLPKSLPLSYDGIGFGDMVYTFDTSGHVSWRFPQNSVVTNEDEYVARQEKHKRGCEECKNLNTAALVVLPSKISSDAEKSR